MGILKVAAVVEQEGYPVEHLDLNGVTNYIEVLGSHLTRTSSRIFAITATTPQNPAATKISKHIRQVVPDARVIVGGPHPTLVHSAVKTTKSARALKSMQQLSEDFDVVVCGDGEEAIKLALDPKRKPPFLIDADDPKQPLFLDSKKIAVSPLPARHLIDLDTYHYKIEDIDVTPVISQLGCSFGCYFCAGRSSPTLRRVRLRSTESVLAELEMLYRRYGIRGFMFFDDELNLNRQIIPLLQAMITLQEKLQVEFRCRGFVKSELFTEEHAHWMWRAGFRKILCGFESGSERILKNINKRATKDENTRTMEISHKFGLDMKALMSIGHPGECRQSIQDTVDWLLQVRPADFDLTIITPYPGSPYHDRSVHLRDNIWMFETNGDRLYMIDVDYSQVSDYYKGAMDSYESFVFTDDLSARSLVEARDWCERTVRERLGIPFYQAGGAWTFESSMGQLPGFIYRRSNL